MNLDLQQGQFLFFERSNVQRLGQTLGQWDEIERTDRGYIARKVRRDGGDYYNVFPTFQQAQYALGLDDQEVLETLGFQD